MSSVPGPDLLPSQVLQGRSENSNPTSWKLTFAFSIRPICIRLWVGLKDSCSRLPNFLSSRDFLQATDICLQDCFLPIYPRADPEAQMRFQIERLSSKTGCPQSQRHRTCQKGVFATNGGFKDPLTGSGAGPRHICANGNNFSNL